ncbi:hypothetical protein KKG71_00475 [Patescibacteria group bacterium]|nr:hypothetical protein [Patescibacteria group bacterium]
MATKGRKERETYGADQAMKETSLISEVVAEANYRGRCIAAITRLSSSGKKEEITKVLKLFCEGYFDPLFTDQIGKFLPKLLSRFFENDKLTPQFFGIVMNKLELEQKIDYAEFFLNACPEEFERVIDDLLYLCGLLTKYLFAKSTKIDELCVLLDEEHPEMVACVIDKYREDIEDLLNFTKKNGKRKK